MKSQNTQVINANVLDWAKDYDGPPFHAILCDPPYNYQFMSKDWDDAIAMHPETWGAIATHLLPGAFIMAFGGARTYHRLAVALEDAGLRIHPAFGWLNGQGFPKATRVKHKGWEGHRYGLQAIKPVLEFIALAQVPYEGKPMDSITASGAGALNIEQSRIGSDTIQTNHYNAIGDMTSFHQSQAGNTYDSSKHQGRWPANFALGHAAGCKPLGTRRVRGGSRWTKDDTGAIWGSGDDSGINHADADGLETVVAWECVDGCPVRRLGEQSGEQGGKYSAPKARKRNDGIGLGGNVVRFGTSDAPDNYGDKGTAARFYHNADWSYEVAEQLAAADAIRYQAKAARQERDAGLDGGQIMPNAGKRTLSGGEDTRGRPQALVRNGHPTVKPIALTKWLATLLIPPPEYAPRRILVPFSGSGSEMIGAYQAGWEEIVGIELEAEYCKIAKARLSYWTGELLRGLTQCRTLT
jgi:site-specific DNA-methyltransferase (adenine-specific)